MLLSAVNTNTAWTLYDLSIIGQFHMVSFSCVGGFVWMGVSVFPPVCWASGKMQQGTHSLILMYSCALISFCGRVYLEPRIFWCFMQAHIDLIRLRLFGLYVFQASCISSIKLQVDILLSSRPLLSSNMACSTLVQILTFILTHSLYRNCRLGAWSFSTIWVLCFETSEWLFEYLSGNNILRVQHLG